MIARRWPDQVFVGSGFQRHHLLPLGLLQRPQFVQFFAALSVEGFRIRRFSSNGLALPSVESLALETGHALHRGPHPAYSDVVAARIEAIRQSAALDTPQTRRMAAARVVTLQAALRRALTDRHGFRFWLNRRDPMRIFGDRPYLDDAIFALLGESKMPPLTEASGGIAICPDQ